MGAKKKTKAGNNQKPIVNTNATQPQETKSKNQKKQEQMQKIMAAINNMDLDQKQFIDVTSFDQSKAILQNALDDLQHYLKLFESGVYDKFPRVKAE